MKTKCSKNGNGSSCFSKLYSLLSLTVDRNNPKQKSLLSKRLSLQAAENRLTIHSITSVMKMRQDAKTRWLVMSLIRGLPFGEGAGLLLHPTKKENLPIRSCNRNFFNRKGVHCILSVVLLLEAQGQLY